MTDSNGDFTVQVPPGTYTVAQTNNPGFDDVSDSDGGDPNEITVDVTGGDSTDNLFVDELPSSASSVSASPSASPTRSCQSRKIQGTVREDTDNDNGGDVPIPMVTIESYSSSGVLVNVTTTDSNGVFMSLVCLLGCAGQSDSLLGRGDSDGDDPNMMSMDVTTSDSVVNVFVDELPSASPTVSSSPSASPSTQPF